MFSSMHYDTVEQLEYSQTILSLNEMNYVLRWKAEYEHTELSEQFQYFYCALKKCRGVLLNTTLKNTFCNTMINCSNIIKHETLVHMTAESTHYEISYLEWIFVYVIKYGSTKSKVCSWKICIIICNYGVVNEPRNIFVKLYCWKLYITII